MYIIKKLIFFFMNLCKRDKKLFIFKMNNEKKPMKDQGKDNDSQGCYMYCV